MLDKTIGDLRLVIEQDESQDPRDNDHAGTMVCWHRSYKLGDEQPDEQPAEWFRTHLEGRTDVAYLPLHLYDHSGVTMNTYGFHCPWDSGQVGWIWAELEDHDPALLREQLVAEVAEYDLHLRGCCWRYAAMEHCDSCSGWETIDSCGGILAEDPRELMKDYLLEQYHPLLED